MSMRMTLLVAFAAGLLWYGAVLYSGASGPYENGTFQGRIAYSCDGNHNDPDDWASSPVALAIFAESGLKDRVVHFDYNCILPKTDPEWERIHEEGVLGAAGHYGYDRSIFYNCHQDLDGAVAGITRAINESSAENPLYLIVAGPMQVPVMGILKSDPEKRKYVYCISHSFWNDGYSLKYTYTHTKRDVIATGINWVQIPSQRLLQTSPYGRKPYDQEWTPFHWMRDSQDPKVRFLWERLKVSTRPDCSDAGMAYFVATGDQLADPEKLRNLLENKQLPKRIRERDEIRIEAENFRELGGFELKNVGTTEVSQRLAVRLAEGEIGRIRTTFSEPFTASAETYGVEIRYRGESSLPNQFEFMINAKTHGSWKSSGSGKSWMTHTIRNVNLRNGDEILIETKGAPVQIDYVQFNRPSAAAANGQSSHFRFKATGKPDDPQALPGQIIAVGKNPGYLKYNGGGTAFLCGPDNPEDFLFLGDLNADGTRSNGPQQLIIDRMAEAGVNAFHFQMFRMRRCNIKDEGDDRHSPFVNFDPAQPLNEAMLDQWDGWISRMEKHGIVIHLEFYNDATDVEMMGWKLDENGELHPHEKRFFEGIVNRFKHHRNIIWGIEESLNKLPRTRTPHFMKLSELIARVDVHNHPIVHSFVTPDTTERDFGADQIMSDEYAGDPYIRIATWLHVLPHGDDYEAQHQAYLKYAGIDTDRFILMKNETERHPRTQPQSRRYMWSCAMTGMHTLEAGHNPLRTPELLADDGRIVQFMEQTDFYAMRSHDELAHGSTNWVLGDKDSYIAYTYNYSGPMGIKGVAAGTYDLKWFDTVNGNTVNQPGVAVASRDVTWNKPDSFGSEIALYIKRRQG